MYVITIILDSIKTILFKNKTHFVRVSRKYIILYSNWTVDRNTYLRIRRIKARNNRKSVVIILKNNEKKERLKF